VREDTRELPDTRGDLDAPALQRAADEKRRDRNAVRQRMEAACPCRRRDQPDRHLVDRPAVRQSVHEHRRLEEEAAAPQANVVEERHGIDAKPRLGVADRMSGDPVHPVAREQDRQRAGARQRLVALRDPAADDDGARRRGRGRQ
jgi:hypothetical protein